MPGGQRVTGSVFLHCFPPYILSKDLLLDLELTSSVDSYLACSRDAISTSYVLGFQAGQHLPSFYVGSDGLTLCPSLPSTEILCMSHHAQHLLPTSS